MQKEKVADLKYMDTFERGLICHLPGRSTDGFVNSGATENADLFVELIYYYGNLV